MSNFFSQGYGVFRSSALDWERMQVNNKLNNNFDIGSLELKYERWNDWVL